MECPYSNRWNVPIPTDGLDCSRDSWVIKVLLVLSSISESSQSAIQSAPPPPPPPPLSFSLKILISPVRRTFPEALGTQIQVAQVAPTWPKSPPRGPSVPPVRHRAQLWGQTCMNVNNQPTRGALTNEY